MNLGNISKRVIKEKKCSEEWCENTLLSSNKKVAVYLSSYTGDNQQTAVNKPMHDCSQITNSKGIGFFELGARKISCI